MNQFDSDKLFEGNLIALVTSEMRLVEIGKKEKIDREMLMEWIKEHTPKKPI